MKGKELQRETATSSHPVLQNSGKCRYKYTYAVGYRTSIPFTLFQSSLVPTFSGICSTLPILYPIHKLSMAPSSLFDTQPTAPHNLSSPAQKPVDRKIFPDGIKTSGQHPPLSEHIRPYSDFPKEITGETVWKAEDYANNPERWIHVFDEEEIAELSAVADIFLAANLPLTGISKDNFKLNKLATLLESIRKETLDGKGFILFKGFPVEKWGNHKSAVAYMGLGTYLGYFISQNGRGHVLGHVKDVGDDPTQTHRVRIYRTNAR